MNSVGEIKREDVIGLNINDITPHHRRSVRTLDKVYQIYVVLYIKELSLIINDLNSLSL